MKPRESQDKSLSSTKDALAGAVKLIAEIAALTDNQARVPENNEQQVKPKMHSIENQLGEHYKRLLFELGTKNENKAPSNLTWRLHLAS